jgi:hypothetical protein
MFDSKGEEMNIVIDFGVQMILEKAKSTRILLVLPANYFLPESQNNIVVIQERL